MKIQINTTGTEITSKELAALEALRGMQADVMELVVLIKELVGKIGRGSVRRARKCILLGEAELRNSEKTVSFAQAVEASLKEREGRRQRTVSDFRYITRRFIKRCPGLGQRRVRSIKPQECAQWIEAAFDTPAQRKKARSILSGVFGSAMRRGWCSENPVSKVRTPQVTEQRIEILKESEIQQLIRAASEYESGSCLPAVGMMLYAGIRPHEIERLTWDAVDLESMRISISPRHSKTGGARCVTILPPLANILLAERSSTAHANTAKICPPNWRTHWRRLHQAAGFSRWQPDVLRHTYASHHLSHFRSYTDLQLEMGHRSIDLLRTRYINMPCKSIFAPHPAESNDAG